MIQILPYKSSYVDLNTDSLNVAKYIKQNAAKGHTSWDIDETYDSDPSVYRHQYERTSSGLKIRRMNDRWGHNLTIWTIMKLDLKRSSINQLNYTVHFNITGNLIYFGSILSILYGITSFDTSKIWLICLSVFCLIGMTINFNVSTRENLDFLKEIKNTAANTR